MRGSVHKKGSRWYVVVELDRDPTTNKRRQKWHGSWSTKKEAEAACTDLVKSVNDGVYVQPSRQTVSTFLAEWLPAIRPTVRPSTFESYRRNIEHHVTPYLGALELRQVDGGRLNRLYADLLATGRRDGEAGLSPTTVRYVATILHRALGDAVRWDRLIRNPADAANPPKVSAAARSTMQTWTGAELRGFLEASEASGDRYYAGWVMLATTGARRGEVLGLRWADVDLEVGRASIEQTVITVRHAVEFGTPKTAKGARSLRIDAGTVAALKTHRARQLEERLAIGAGWRDHDLVFTKVDGSPLHPERFSREFDRRVERWSLPRIRLHDLRHTWATLALEAGVPAKVVSERLGHANISITLDVYSHVNEAMDAGAAERVASVIFGTDG